MMDSPNSVIAAESAAKPSPWRRHSWRVAALAAFFAAASCGAFGAYTWTKLESLGESAVSLAALGCVFGWLPVLPLLAHRLRDSRNALLFGLVYGMAIGGFSTVYWNWWKSAHGVQVSDRLALQQIRTIQPASDGGEMHYFEPPAVGGTYISAYRIPAFDPSRGDVMLGMVVGGLATAAVSWPIWLAIYLARGHRWDLEAKPGHERRATAA